MDPKIISMNGDDLLDFDFLEKVKTNLSDGIFK